MRVLPAMRALRWRTPALVVAAAALAASPWWGPRVLAPIPYFHVRRIELHGVHFLRPSSVLRRLAVDSSRSVWANLAPLDRRVAREPGVAAVRISRRLPGTLVVRVTEENPVALVPTGGRLVAVDSLGRRLPFDPARAAVDLPVLGASDTMLVRLLAAIRGASTPLFDQISSLRRNGRGELALTVGQMRVLARTNLTPRRLADIVPVERDLARRHAHAVELDLRFRDQVIARVQ